MRTRILRLPEIIETVGLSRSTIYDYIGRGKFPRQVQIGIRSVGWFEEDIRQWMMKRSKSKDEDIK